MKFDNEKLSERNVRQWVEICQNSPNSWVHHYGVIFKNSNNHSFILRCNQQPIAIIPFCLEGNAASFFGLSLPMPLICSSVRYESERYKKIEKEIFLQIDRYAIEQNLVKASYVVANSRAYCFNPLKRYGYLNTSLLDMVIDLTQREDLLWSKLSKGHKSDIKNGLKEKVFIEIFSGNEHQQSKMLKKLETFQPQHPREYLSTLIGNQYAEILLLKVGSEVLGAALFLKYNGTVQYHESVRFHHDCLPVHHILLWLAVQKYKKDGFKALDLGVFSYSSQLNYLVDETKRRMSTFKRGFSPEIRDLYLGEKYFSKKEFTETFEQRITKFSDCEL